MIPLAAVDLDVGTAIRLAVTVGLAAAALDLVPGVAVGWALARLRFRGKAAVSALVALPVVLPPVVLGWLLLEFFGRRGLLGPALERAGIEVAFAFPGAVLAAAAAGFPFVVAGARLGIEGVDRRLEGIAETLGASRAGAFFRVTLPLAAPGIAAGLVLAFARGLGEYGATQVFAGNMEGKTRTISLAVYTLLEAPGDDPRVPVLVCAAIALSALALGAHEWLSRRASR